MHRWQGRLHTLARISAHEPMVELITDEMVGVPAVVGTPEQCTAQICERFAADADRVCACFPGYPVADQHFADPAAALRTPALGHLPAGS